MDGNWRSASLFGGKGRLFGRALFCAAVAAFVALCPPAHAQEFSKPKTSDASKGMMNADVSLIPRALLFGNPERAAGRLSPDGKWFTFLAPRDGVLNLFITPREGLDIQNARPLTSDTKRGIRRYEWAYDSKHLIYFQDEGGNEDFRIHSVNIETGKDVVLTPSAGVQARLAARSPSFPGRVVLALNDRNPQFHDLHIVDVATGAREPLQQNDGYVGFDVDDNFKVRFAYKPNPDGSLAMLKALPSEEGGTAFEDYDVISLEDANSFSVEGFDSTGKLAYILDARGRDTAALFELDIASKSKKLLTDNPLTDATEVFMHPSERRPQGVIFNYEKPEWNVLETPLIGDFQFLYTGAESSALSITSRTLDDRYWTAVFVDSNAPARTMIYDRGEPGQAKPKRKLDLAFYSIAALKDRSLATMHPATIRARDGLKMVCYLSLPVARDPDGDGRPDRPIPLILNVHGGPWARDQWGFDPEHQWLANRGYAVLSVNFRGSTGFGKRFLNAANKEWAGKMHDDLIDALDWAVKEKIADPAKVAITGGSYGGYATLTGLTFTPDTFACGVAVVGPSSLLTLLESIPPYWKPMLDMFASRVGDPRTQEGRDLLIARSPLTKVDQIRKPLLIGQGANDPRVKQAESDQIVSAMQAKGIPVTYVLYPDEGHGFARPENRMSFFAVAEAFYSRHLGGRFEPIGDALKGSSITVPSGADLLPGLSEALAAPR